MKILFTGFNGFNNTSKVIIDKINNDKLLFNNSYKEIDNQLVNSNVEEYDLIIMLGLKSNLKRSIRLEVNSLLNDELVTTNISYCNVKKYFNDNGISPGGAAPGGRSRSCLAPWQGGGPVRRPDR